MRASGLGCLRLRRRCPNGCSFYLAKCLTWPDSRERRSRAVSLPVSEGSVRRRFGAFVSLPPSKHLEATTELTFVLRFGVLWNDGPKLTSQQIRLAGPRHGALSWGRRSRAARLQDQAVFYLARCVTWPDSWERRSRAVSLPVSEGSVRRRFGAFVSLPPSKHLIGGLT